MCTCIEETEQLMRKRFAEDNTRLKSIDVSECRYTKATWPLSKKMSLQEQSLYGEMKITYTFEKVDGSRSKEKTTLLGVVFHYCPICGKPYKRDDK